MWTYKHCQGYECRKHGDSILTCCYREHGIKSLQSYVRNVLFAAVCWHSSIKLMFPNISNTATYLSINLAIKPWLDLHGRKGIQAVYGGQVAGNPFLLLEYVTSHSAMCSAASSTDSACRNVFSVLTPCLPPEVLLSWKSSGQGLLGRDSVDVTSHLGVGYWCRRIWALSRNLRGGAWGTGVEEYEGVAGAASIAGVYPAVIQRWSSRRHCQRLRLLRMLRCGWIDGRALWEFEPGMKC